MNIALYKDGRYYKEKVVDGHLVENTNSDNKFVEIYDIWSQCSYGYVLTEEKLQSLNIPNLGYIKTSTGFEIFDKTKEEYIEEQLPVYVDVLGKVVKSKKWVALKTPTQEAIEASKSIYRKVQNELYKISRKEEVKRAITLVEKGNGIAYLNTRMYYIYDLVEVLYREGIKVLFSSNGRYIIGNVAKKPVLDLYVPKSIVPMVIGRGGEMIKNIATEINAKRINVKSIED